MTESQTAIETQSPAPPSSEPHPVVKARRVLMPEAPSWKWIVGAIASVTVVLVIPAALWAGAVKADMTTMVKSVETLTETQTKEAEERAAIRKDFLETQKEGAKERVELLKAISAISERQAALEVGAAEARRALDRIEIRLDKK